MKLRDNFKLIVLDNWKHSNLFYLVPENCNFNDSPGQYGLKIASSNMPRHILQRKQVEKLNKKKLVDLHDKENWIYMHYSNILYLCKIFFDNHHEVFKSCKKWI